MYLVKIKFTTNCGDRSIWQFYLVKHNDLKFITKIDREIGSGCCGQSQCFICSSNGVHAKYDGCKKVTDSEIDLAKFVVENDHKYLSYEKLIDRYCDDNDSDND